MDANGFFFFSIELRLAETKFVFLKIYRSKLETTMVTNDDDDDDDDDVVVDDNHGLFIFHRSQTVCASHKRSAKPSLNLDPLLTWSFEDEADSATRRELLRVDFLRLIRRIQLVFIFWVTDLNPSLARQRQPQDVKQTSKLLLWQREPMTIAGAGVSLVEGSLVSRCLYNLLCQSLALTDCIALGAFMV